ncbi:TPA: HNH endonuclease, partial [Neisseria meningitidis]
TKQVTKGVFDGKGEAKIPSYTWHHHQDTGRMQLISERKHTQTGHIGGEAMDKGK